MDTNRLYQLIKQFWAVLLIVLSTIPAILPFFQPGLFSTFDGMTLVARSAYFYQSLTDGNVIPRWADVLTFNLGSPVIMFYGYLPNYLSSLFHFIGFSYVDCYKILLGLSLVLSGLFFYLFAKKPFGQIAAVVGAIFYVWAPYRFLDIYVRGELAESVALVFLPLILYATNNLVIRPAKKWIILLSLFFVLILLSHNLIAILGFVLSVGYGVCFGIVLHRLHNVKYILIAVIFSLLLGAFYWLPALWEKSYINADLLNFSAPYLNNFITLKQLIYSPWGWGPLGSSSPMSLQLGLIQILVIILMTILLVLFSINRTVKNNTLWRLNNLLIVEKISSSDFAHYSFFIILFLITIFLMTPTSSGLWQHINLLSFFLYPWRFLSIAILSAAIMAALLVKLVKKPKLISLILIVLLFYANRNHLHLQSSFSMSDEQVLAYHDTSDMWGEYLPKDASLAMITRCREENCWFNKIQFPAAVLISNLQQSTNILQFDYRSDKDFVGTINILYFPGWTYYLDQQQINNYKINKIGTVDLNLPTGEHSITVIFAETLLQRVSLLISLLGVGGGLLYLWRIKLV
ncbi:MAG: hypothetical protein M1607_00555 [Patescibacteria group bacterium]|nr:hypothetical protein [Patescibacteria group bacterium]